MVNQNVVYLGIIVSAIGSVSYLLDTVKGNIQPNRVSFTLWSIAPLIAFFAEFKQGVGIQSLLPLSVGLFPLIILIGTFVNKKAYWKISKFDLFCGLLSLLGLLFWYITKLGNWAIFFSILADGFAGIPTVIKAYHHPETESAWPWLGFSFSGLCTLLSLQTWNFTTSAFPIYFVFMNTLIYIIVQFKVGKRI